MRCLNNLSIAIKIALDAEGYREKKEWTFRSADPLWADLWITTTPSLRIIQRYLQPLRERQADTVSYASSSDITVNRTTKKHKETETKEIRF